MKYIRVSLITLILLMFFGLSLSAEEYRPFTGARISMAESFTMMKPECGRERYLPTVGTFFQDFDQEHGIQGFTTPTGIQ